jgi:phosphoglycerate dehydrogenase-like enzyme
MVTVAILDDYQSVALDSASWSELGDGVSLHVFTERLVGAHRIVEALEPFDVVVAMRERTPFPAEVLERLPNLRLLVTTGMANAAIDMDAARRARVVVSGTPGLVAPPAELAWALILALGRHVCAEDSQMRRGGWQHTIGSDLAGNTLGLIGLGNIGARMAAVGRAFGMDVVAWSENLDARTASDRGARAVQKRELFSTADVVSIHLVLSDRTRGLVGSEELAWMKRTAYLVNTSRGPIVDEHALVDALQAGAIAGAGLDVFDVEPLPTDHPLRTAPRTVLTPHLGFVSRAMYEVFYGAALEAVAGYLAGSPIRVLNP